MSKLEKLLKRFLSRPKDLTFNELQQALKSLGYSEAGAGKTSGSRVAFYNKQIDDMIKFHRPHPSQIMKRCYLIEIEKHLREKGVVK